MYRLTNWYMKITGWAFPLLCRLKVHYEDRAVQSRKIKGKAIVCSNHTGLLDFGATLFTYFPRTLRCVMSEALYNKFFLLTGFVYFIGGIKANRETHDFSFITKCKQVLDKGGVVEIYPEGRIPDEPSNIPLPFKPSVVLMAIECDAPIIPTFTNGKYFSKQRLRTIIGKPVYVSELYDESISEKENIAKITEHLRERTIELANELERQVEEEKSKKKK